MAVALVLTLYPMSHMGHDAHDVNGDVQIKMTAGKCAAMRADRPERNLDEMSGERQ